MSESDQRERLPTYPIYSVVYTVPPPDLGLSVAYYCVVSLADGPEFSTGLYLPARCVGPFTFELMTIDALEGDSQREAVLPLCRSERRAWEWIARQARSKQGGPAR